MSGLLRFSACLKGLPRCFDAWRGRPSPRCNSATLLTHRGVGPTPPPSPHCAASTPRKHPQAKPPARGLIAAATAKPTPRSTASLYRACDGMPVPVTTSPPHHQRKNPPLSHPLLKAPHRSRDLSDHHIATANTAVSSLTSREHQCR